MHGQTGHVDTDIADEEIFCPVACVGWCCLLVIHINVYILYIHSHDCPPWPVARVTVWYHQGQHCCLYHPRTDVFYLCIWSHMTQLTLDTCQPTNMCTLWYNSYCMMPVPIVRVRTLKCDLNYVKQWIWIVKMIKSRSLLLIILLLTKCLNCDPRGPGDGRFRQSRFLDFPDFEFLDEAVGDVGRDFSQIYTGWVNSSFIYPYYLKVTFLSLLQSSELFRCIESSRYVNDQNG